VAAVDVTTAVLEVVVVDVVVHHPEAMEVAVAEVVIRIHGVTVEVEEMREATGVEVVAPGKILPATGEIAEVVNGKEDGKEILVAAAEEDTEVKLMVETVAVDMVVVVEISVAITKEVVAVAP